MYQQKQIITQKLYIMTTLLKYNKTESQENKLAQLVFSDVYKRVVSRASLVNENLLVKAVDTNGREDFTELTSDGELIETALWF